MRCCCARCRIATRIAGDFVESVAGLNIAEDWFFYCAVLRHKDSQSGFEQLAIAIGALQSDRRRASRSAWHIRVSVICFRCLGAIPRWVRLFVRRKKTRPGRPGYSGVELWQWQRRYGFGTGVLGRSITLNGQTYQIAGVLRRTFFAPREGCRRWAGGQSEILVSLPLGAKCRDDSQSRRLNIMGKLKARGHGAAGAVGDGTG